MLTQAEIDALLTGSIEIEGRDGESTVNLAELMGQTTTNFKEQEEERKIQAYNFWSPDRFSKEQMRAVELVHEDLTERLTTSLPSFLRVNLRPRVVHIEQGRFHDFLRDFPQTSLFHMITLAPLPGQTVLTISPDVCIKILEQRLGGKIEGNKKDRGLTDIDQSLLRGLVEFMLNDLKAAWSKVAAIEPSLEDSTVNQHWVQMLIGNERVMLITFEMSIQGITGTMTIYIPFSTLKPIANVLNPHVWISGRKTREPDQAMKQANLENMTRVSIPVTVFLGKTELELQDVLHLSVGDIIQLDTSIDQDLIVQVANEPRFTGKPGKSGKKLAVRISTIMRDAFDSDQAADEGGHFDNSQFL